MRDDFPDKTKDTLAKRVGMHCSNPSCRKPTSGPREDPAKAVNIGVAAHITAAAIGGPRYDSSLNASQRSAITNAIWLCQNCAKLIDNDAARYTVDLLRQWKALSEENAQIGVASTGAALALQQTNPSGERKFSLPYSSVARPQGKESLLTREELYREDFQDGSVVYPAAWVAVLEAAKEKEGGIVAVQAPPGSGKSTLAAWTYWKLSQETRVEYLPGRDFQKLGDTALVEALDALPEKTVVLVDDAHLVQRHLDHLMRSSLAPKMRFLLLSRPQGFASIPGIPKPIDLTATASSIAQELARKYTSTPEEASSLLSESQGDLVFTKWLLGALQQYPSQRKPTLDATVVAKLTQFWDIDRKGEVLRLLLVLAAYRWLELPCAIETLTGTFGFGSETIDALTERLREATLDRSAKSISLDRHPKLAGLFQKTASKFHYYTSDVLKPTCAAFRIDHSMVADARFGHVVLGLAVACELVRASDVFDRLLLSKLHADCVDFANAAARIELLVKGSASSLDPPTVERRLTISFAIYDAMRREYDEAQAWASLGDLRSRLGVTGTPEVDFERKGSLLYQTASHYLLTNELREALRLLSAAADADDRWAAKTTISPARFRGAACMSRILAVRADADVELASADSDADPAPDLNQIRAFAEKLEVERATLGQLMQATQGTDWLWLCRWHRNALCHLAELRACLGEAEAVKDLVQQATEEEKAINSRFAEEVAASLALAQATLEFTRGRFDAVVDLLKEIPRKQLKGGERTGRPAQLLALSERNRGRLDEFEKWCQWLASKCPADKANGPAVSWARAVLKGRETKPK